VEGSERGTGDSGRLCSSGDELTEGQLIAVFGLGLLDEVRHRGSEVRWLFDVQEVAGVLEDLEPAAGDAIRGRVGARSERAGADDFRRASRTARSFVRPLR